MLYKPKFCCNCAEKIERIDWNLLTSRRFCEACSAENRRYDHLPRAVVAGGALSIMFGLGTIFGGSSPSATPVQTLNASQGSSSEKPFGTHGQTPGEPSAIVPKVPGNGVPQAVQTVENKQPAPERVFYCRALTKKGTPCSRKVKAQRARCYQHEGKPPVAES